METYDSPIRVEYRQREYDGKWEKIGLFVDINNSYSYRSETGGTITLFPEKWITMNVYDYELEFVD